MIWVGTAAILLLISAGITYMLMSIIKDDNEITFQDYLETYIIVLMLMAFAIYIGG